MISQYMPHLADKGITRHVVGDIQFFVSGDQPEVVIASGLHGDEWPIITWLTETILTMADQLPPFLFIPMVSPSAVAAKTRINQDGIDINRSFKDEETEYQETETVKKILQLYQPYKTVLTIHQDIEQEAAYLYDGHVTAYDQKVQSWQEALREREIQFLNDVDDASDPELGISFEDGYFNFHPTERFDGSLESWVSRHAGAARNLTLEVPALASEAEQRVIIEESLKWLL